MPIAPRPSRLAHHRKILAKRGICSAFPGSVDPTKLGAGRKQQLNADLFRPAGAVRRRFPLLVQQQVEGESEHCGAAGAGEILPLTSGEGSGRRQC
jgi:hypothetical protein